MTDLLVETSQRTFVELNILDANLPVTDTPCQVTVLPGLDDKPQSLQFPFGVKPNDGSHRPLMTLAPATTFGVILVTPNACADQR